MPAPIDNPPPAGFHRSSPPSAFDAMNAPQTQSPQFAPPPTPNGGADPVPSTTAALNQSILDLASTTAVSDASIQIAIDGSDYTFLPGSEITIGRDPTCLVTVDERHSLVSRKHLKINYHDNHWWIDDYSSKGTYVDGRKISSPYKAEGAFMVQLGDGDAGTPMRVITAGEHQAPRKQNILLLAVIGLLALIAIGALVIALRGGGGGSDESGLTVTDQVPADATLEPGVVNGAVGDVVPTQDLASAKQSTVLLIGDTGLGSGFFVADRLIVTNQHVAELATSLDVAVSRTADEPAVMEYIAETVARHPFLDIAVLELTADASGSQVDASGLPSAAIGDSAAVTLGDKVYSTGFGALLAPVSRDDMGDVQLPSVGITSGEAANFSIWPGCSNPDQELLLPIGLPEGVSCAPDGDIAKGIVLTTFSTDQGASGGPVFRGNEVIAVVFAGPEDEANAGQNITTSTFAAWLDGVIAENA
jgi:hypothetical protein